jgi:transforming growth factor-beta-induced protein
MKRITLITTILILSFVLAACGATNEPPVESATSSIAEAPAAEEEMMEEAKSIVEIASEDGRFNTLVAAVTAAGLAETLSNDGTFTVFAPTDDAFAALPEGTVESLLEDPQGALTDILLYHVVDSVVPAETVVTLDSATTMQGEDVAISVTNGEVFLNETAKVIITDIEASNGIIHVIDAVILPPSVIAAAEEGMEDEAMAEDEMMGAMSIAEIAAEDGRFNTLVAAVTAAGLAETLSNDGTFTVFAPTDDAFAALPEGTVESLLEDPQGALTDILLYHVLGTIVPASEVVNYDSAVTLQGQSISIAVVDGEVFLNDDVKVIITDIEASNGVIHVIDAVLLPPAEEASSAPVTFVQMQQKSHADCGGSGGSNA